MMSTHAIACHYSAPRQSQRDGRGEKRRLLGARRKGGRDGDDASRQSMGKTRSGDSRCGEDALPCLDSGSGSVTLPPFGPYSIT